ncbi:protein of unknown function [Streptantibioticus cattleyicolor NRRL 8057 = DSM 46488]|nr:protein of unknown function [Streptantibioticus cattleyicolor NRRL 8057 = DSM 46488]
MAGQLRYLTPLWTGMVRRDLGDRPPLWRTTLRQPNGLGVSVGRGFVNRNA